MDLRVGDRIVVDFVDDDQEPPTNGYYHNVCGVVTEILPAPNRYSKQVDVVRLSLNLLGDTFLYARNVRHKE